MSAQLSRQEQELHFGTRGNRDVPCNIPAEQALLGALMVNNDAMDALGVDLEPKHFFDPIHGDMFDAFIDLRKAGRKINPVTAKAYVPEGMIDGLTPSQYLAHLAAEAVSVVNVPDYARAIMEAAARRSCMTLGEMLDRAAVSKELDISDEIDAIRGRFEDIMRALNGTPQARTLADGARRALDATADAYRGHGLAGVDYGLSFLTSMIGPFMPGQLIIVGGGTKQGKSSLIEQMIHGAAVNGHPVWVYSGEMNVEELAHRSLSRDTGIQAWRQIRGKVSDSEYEKLDTARRNAETWQDRVAVRDDSMTLAQMERDLKDFAKRHPGGMAIVDKIDLIERDKESARMTDTEFGPYVTRRLKMTANRFRMPVIAVAPLKKNTFSVDDRKMSKATFLQAIGRRPRYGDIFGNCEKDANHVLIPFRAEPILQELEPAEGNELYPIWEGIMDGVRGKAEIILALSRHCQWPQRREVGWNGGRTMFTDPQAGDQSRMAV